MIPVRQQTQLPTMPKSMQPIYHSEAVGVEIQGTFIGKK